MIGVVLQTISHIVFLIFCRKMDTIFSVWDSFGKTDCSSLTF